MQPKDRSYVTSRYRVVCQCFVQLKFRVSEKFTKNWCNLPDDFVISKLWCRFLWPSQNIWTLRIRNKIWILVLIRNMQSNCLRSGLEYIFGFPFQTAHYFTLVSNFTPNRYGKEIQIILRIFLASSINRSTSHVTIWLGRKSRYMQ